MLPAASQLICKQVLSCLTRLPQALALQQLPMLQQQPADQHWGNISVQTEPKVLIRSYARLPEKQTSFRIADHAASDQQHKQQPGLSKQPYPKQFNGPVQKLYKGKWIIPVRFLVRAKIFQLLGCGSIGVVLGSLTLQEANWMDVMALTGLAGGMVAASYCLWYYSRRYVGEMGLLLPEGKYVRLSVLDFWGNREDNDVPIAAIQTFKGVRPKEISRVTSQLLFPVNVHGDRQYYFNNIHEANILEKEIFYSILKGEFDPTATAAPADSGEQPEQQGQQQEQQPQA